MTHFCIWKQIKDRVSAVAVQDFRCLRRLVDPEKYAETPYEAEGHTQEEGELCEMHTSSLSFSPPVLTPLTAQPINRRRV